MVVQRASNEKEKQNKRACKEQTSRRHDIIGPKHHRRIQPTKLMEISNGFSASDSCAAHQGNSYNKANSEPFRRRIVPNGGFGKDLGMFDTVRQNPYVLRNFIRTISRQSSMFLLVPETQPICQSKSR
jgi:hypothetical protein